MKSSPQQLQARGYLDPNRVPSTTSYTLQELLDQLKSKNPVDRTLAATLLGQSQRPQALQALLQALTCEAALYTKIALCQSISSFKEKAVAACLPYLGKIGKNQHRMLPSKPFLKDSYPLPRDIIARTLASGDASSIRPLIQGLDQLGRQQLLEGLDALGHLSYYQKNEEAKGFLLALRKKYSDDPIITWKILRTFCAFSGDDVLADLQDVLATSTCHAHLWEAARSLRILAKRS